MKIFFLFLTLFTSSFSLASIDRKGNGGDPIGLEFHNAFLSAAQRAKEKAPAVAEEIERQNLLGVLTNAKILVVDTPLTVLVGKTTQDSAAMNDLATATIFIQRARWRQIDDQNLREALALHEVASLKGLESTGSYPLSGQYLLAVGGSAQDVLSAIQKRSLLRGKFSRSARLQSVKCSTLNKVAMKKDGQEVAFFGFEEGGAFIWEPEAGKTYNLSYSDIDTDGLAGENFTILQNIRQVVDRNERGQEASSNAEFQFFNFTPKNIFEQSAKVSRQILWSSETEGVVTNVRDGVLDPRPMKVLSQNLGPNENVLVNEHEPNHVAGEGENEMRHLSSLSSCATEVLSLDKITEIFQPRMIRLIEIADKKMLTVEIANEAYRICQTTAQDCSSKKALLDAAVASFDQLWKNLIPKKDFDLRRSEVRKEISNPPKAYRERRKTERTNWRNQVSPESSAELRRILDKADRDSRADRYRRPWPGTGFYDHSHQPVYATPWGFRSHRGVPINPGDVSFRNNPVP